MYCPKCGKKLNDDFKFCSNCGYKVKKDNIEQTKEININIIKKVAQNPNFNKKEIKEKENNNSIVISMCTSVILLLVIVLLVMNNGKKRYLFEEDKEIYCNQNPEVCGVEEHQEEKTNFETMDFSDYDFSVSTSKQQFYSSVLNILSTKSENGNNYCNNINYTNASKKINATLGLDYSYLCGMDISYIEALITRLNQFYVLNNINAKIIDAYVVDEDKQSEYVNFNVQTIGSNSTYIAYLRTIHMNLNLFSDYDKLKKTYERELQGGFHPKNSKPEDIIVHETAHALDFYISAKKHGIDSLVIDDLKKYNEFYASWSNQTYSKEVILEAVDKVNNSYQTNDIPPKTEIELKTEISAYANITNNGKVMYAETFAEALVDYLSNGNNASALSIEIYKIVQEDLSNL